MTDFTPDQANEAIAFAEELLGKLEDDYEPTADDVDKAARLMTPILRANLTSLARTTEEIIEALPLSVELYTIETDEAIREFVSLATELAPPMGAIAGLIRATRRHRR